MNWKMVWMKLFGTIELFRLNMGFWVSLGLVCVIVILMNLIFWNMKPINTDKK